MTFARRLVVGLGLLLATSAGAQTYVMSTASSPFVPLTGGTVLALSGSSTPSDEGWAVIPIGFPFRYFEKTYTSITVTANGMAYLENTGCTSGCGYYSNGAMLTASNPNGVLAPYWDDLEQARATSQILYKNTTDAQGGVLTIEWRDFDYAFPSIPYSLNFQLRISQNGNIDFFYGPTTQGSPALTGSIGIEAPQGAVWFGKACSASSPWCPLSEFVTDTSVSFRAPAQADIYGTSVKVSKLTGTSTLTVDTAVGIRNFGMTAANNFRYRLYLSTDKVFDASTDVAFSPAPVGPVSLAALGETVHTAVGSTVAKPATGSFYILAVLDSEAAVTEASETNNLISSTFPYASGVDLVANSVTAPLQGGPGSSVTTSIDFDNRGLNSAGAVAVKIKLSIDASVSADDITVYSGTETVGNAQSVTKDLTFALPTDLVDGDYFLLLQLDDANTVAENSETNNLVASRNKMNSRRADVVLEPVFVKNVAPPNGPAEVAFFSENIRLDVNVSNAGGSTAAGFSVLFYMSDNDALNAFVDPTIEEVVNVTLAPGESKVISVTKPVPAKSANGTTYQPGDFYFFASAATAGKFVELSPNNNTGVSKPQKVRGPAPDLVATSLEGPSEIAPGELFAISRTIRNAGNRPATAAAYRYYLSANPIISEDDIQLLIDVGGETKNEGTVTLAAGAADIQTEKIRVPANVGAATYYLGILVDPPGTTGSGSVLEIFESNNGLATQLISVAAQRLQINSSYLPDAIQGLPYEFWLSAKGGVGGYRFSVVAEGGALPAGLTLTQDGHLSGVPTGSGTTAFTLRVDSNNGFAQARLVLKTVPLTTSLTVTTNTLPALVRLKPFEVYMSAQGGQGPYLWSKESGVLPPGFNFTESGKLTGATTAAVGTAYNFAMRVRDAVGNTDVRNFAVKVLDATGLEIDTTGVVSGVIGQRYIQDVTVRTANGSVVPAPVTWRLANGSLPPGLTLQPQDERLSLSGIPTTAGNFAFSLEIQDGTGRSDSTSFVLPIFAKPAQITGTVPDSFVRGDKVDVKLSLSNFPNARFSVFSGALPVGVTLGTDGALTGQIPDDASAGRYNFSVSAVAQDGSGAMTSFATDVLTTRKKTGGCASVDGTALFGLVVLVPLFTRRGMRRRNRSSLELGKLS
jgi:hypothetical protein